LQAECTIETSRSRLSIRFGQEATDLDPVTTPFWEIDLKDTPTGKVSLDLCQQRPCVLKVREGTDLNPQHPHPFGSSIIADNSKLDLVGSVADHPKGFSAG
jgi:hypothetical protein